MKILKVEKTIQRIKNMDSSKSEKTKIIFDTPKSEKSIRDIPIPNFLLPLLRKFKSNDNYYVAKNSIDFVEPRLMQKNTKQF